MKNKLLILIVVLLASCKPIERVIYVDRYKVSIDTLHTKDSVYITHRDSINVYQKGDTVFKNVYRIDNKYQWKEKIKIKDVTYLITKTVFKQPEKEPKSVFYWIGLVFTILLVLFLLYKANKAFID